MGIPEIILIDTAPAGPAGSMARYSSYVAAALRRIEDAGAARWRMERLAPPEEILRYIPRSLRMWAHHAAVFLGAVRLGTSSGCVLFHILDGSHAYLAPVLARKGAVVVTAHDIIPLLLSAGKIPGDRPSRGGRWLWRRNLAGLRHAARILAVSSKTREDLVESDAQLAAKSEVIHNPVEPGREAGRLAEKPKAPQILHVGHNGSYKNRAGVLEVIACLRRRLRVGGVLVGPPPGDDLRMRARELGVDDCVTWSIGVDDAELNRLYENAAVFLFPSRYEGFGWPPLEAMAAGLPVVCSSAASLPEVVGGAALMAEADDYDALASCCLRLLHDEGLRRRQIEAGYRNLERFSPEIFSGRLAVVYQSVLHSDHGEKRQASSRGGTQVSGETQ